MEELRKLLIANIENDCWFAIRDKMEELGLVLLMQDHDICLDRFHSRHHKRRLRSCTLVHWAVYNEATQWVTNIPWEDQLSYLETLQYKYRDS